MTVKEKLAAAGCEIHDDPLTRALYATDASVYQVTPKAVAFPRSPQEAAAALRAGREAGLSIVPRGAGTGLAGGAVGDGLVIELARHNQAISDFDADTRTVRVEPGVVLDKLNAFLKPHGLCFGPDVATSSRATLGGMIGNNSSGARAPLYGTTADHIVSLEAVLPDGGIADFPADGESGAATRAGSLTGEVDAIAGDNEALIRERFPGVLPKRRPGYGLDRYMQRRQDLTRILAGSEGTLALMMSAVLRLVPLPSEKGIAVIFFDSVPGAMQATVDLLDLHPAAIEHIDRPVFEQTRGQRAFQATRELLGLDEHGCEAALIVEFYDDVADRLAAIARRGLGVHTLTFGDPKEMEMVWNVRKAGLNLLTGRKGPAKPVAGLEDVAVPPERLPEYVDEMRKLVDGLGLQASFYGHAASGLLHVRPVLDLHRVEDIGKFRQLAAEVSRLAGEFRGSIAAEHGVGMARTQFLEDQIGPELLAVMRRIKNAFDPDGVMNPGKIFDTGAYAIHENLRQGPGHEIPVPFRPELGFVDKDGSFVGNLEQCNGCGGCLKEPPTMCPTFQAENAEILSTRGRANTIRAVLEGRIGPVDQPLRARELEEALSYCLSCKACKTECPSNVDMALLKAELLHARHKTEGAGLGDYAISCVDVMNWFGCLAPRLANAALRNGLVRRFMARLLGMSAERPLPTYASERFDAWFRRRTPRPNGTRGRVVLWDDTFVRYNEPQIGKAAVEVLEAAGYEVALAEGHKDSGRPSFSVGRLDRARRLGRHNVRLLRQRNEEEPVLFLEPSVYSMFVQDYKELGIDGAEETAKRCILFEEFVYNLLTASPEALRFEEDRKVVGVHAHCHAKALADPSILAKLAAKLPGRDVRELETGCCGMAGAYGMMESKQALSRKVAEPLVEQVNALGPDAEVVACGTSCRQQVRDLTAARPVHIAELLAQALESTK